MMVGTTGLMCVVATDLIINYGSDAFDDGKNYKVESLKAGSNVQNDSAKNYIAL